LNHDDFLLSTSMLTDIRLQRFRSYEDASFEFDKGVNIIVGPNASGKTNLLEAVYMLAAGSSYRVRDSEVMRFGADWSRLDGDLPGGRRALKLTVAGNGAATKMLGLDDKQIRRIAMRHTLPVVLFEPDHLRLFSGSPEARRDFLDGLLEQSVAEFGGLRRQYRRALMQRNALLKKGPSTNSDLFVWNVRLSELGGRLATHRQELVMRLDEGMTEIYQDISGTDAEVRLSYKTTVQADNYGSSLLKLLQASEELDYTRGFTGYGPHRDDMRVELKGQPTEETASRGEVRTLLLALKVLELRLLEEVRGQRPLLLLDDVFSELDGARRKALTRSLKGYQVFITTTDADVVVRHFMEDCNIIPLGTG
jgi:DNA replication and repair protein RecF